MTAKKLVVSTYLQYIALAAGVILLVAFTRQISGVLLTFLAAGVLAYVLNPLIRRLEGWRVPRIVAVLGVFLILAVVVVAGVLGLVIPAVGQVQNIVQDPQAIVRQANSLLEQAQSLPYVGSYIADLDQDRVLQLLRENAPSPGQVLDVATGVIGGVFGIFGSLVNLLLMVLVSVYLLMDRERITRAIHRVIPETVHDQTFELFSAVESNLVRYLRGQIFLCALMGVIGFAIAYFAIGEYAILIGLWVGITELIPVLGAYLGAVPAVVIALIVPGGGFTTALIVIGLFIVAQQLEGNILVPRIQGDSVGVHSLWVLFAILAGTALYGIIGAIFAVPVVAIVAATVRYLRSTLIMERWTKPAVTPADEESTADLPGIEKDEPASQATGVGSSRSGEEQGKG